MNTPLSTEHVGSADYAKAATELLQNAERLIAGGCFEQAHAALDLLTQPGPWKAGGHGRVTRTLERLLPVACHLTGRPSPAIGEVSAMSVPQLAAWAEEEAGRIQDSLAMVGRNQLDPAGDNWSQAYLEGLPAIADAEARKRAFQDFLLDAEFVLKQRLADAVDAAPLDIGGLLADLLNGTLPDSYEMDVTKLLGGLAASIEVAPAAQAIPTGLIARTAAESMRVTGSPPTYMTDFLFHAATVLALRAGHPEEAAFAAGALTHSELGLSTLVHAAVWPPLAELLRSGACAGAAGVDAASADPYLATLRRRPAVPPGAAPAKPAYTADTLDAFRAILAGTPLAGREIVELPILDTPERAYAIAARSKEMESLWKEARKLLDNTQRWPLLVTLWGGNASAGLEGALREEDLFSRFYFEEAPDADDVSPRAILADADSADVAQFLRRRMQHREDVDRLDADVIEYELDTTRGVCGTAPSPDEVARARLDGKPVTTAYQLDRWLLDWERAHGARINLDHVRQEWFDPGTAVLLFLPTPHPWDALAYVSFFGSAYYGVENYIALGRQWQERYGAELVAHFGTMLQCYVSRPPATQEEAWQLAVEQDIAASCTLSGPGISLRHHAAGLVGHDRWFLHERP